MLNLLIHLATLFLSPDTSKLAQATQRYAPGYLNHETALLHVFAATAASDDEVSPELLLGMAYIESRYTPDATSRIEGSTRITGVPRWSSPPSDTHGPYFCGVTQADARFSWERCTELRNIFVAYATTTKELKLWLHHPLCRASDEPMRCALWGYGGGKPAIESKTSTYPSRVLSRAAALLRAVSSSS